jgi:hypothetical protein
MRGEDYQMNQVLSETWRHKLETASFKQMQPRMHNKGPQPQLVEGGNKEEGKTRDRRKRGRIIYK